MIRFGAPFLTNSGFTRRRMLKLEREEREGRRAGGWTDLDCGVSVPPGRVRAGEGDPAASAAEALKKADSVYSSSNSSTSPPNLSPAASIP